MRKFEARKLSAIQWFRNSTLVFATNQIELFAVGGIRRGGHQPSGKRVGFFKTSLRKFEARKLSAIQWFRTSALVFATNQIKLFAVGGIRRGGYQPSGNVIAEFFLTDSS